VCLLDKNNFIILKINKMEKLLLPKTDENGVGLVSYSQVSLWEEVKSFNLSILGRYEYIRSKMLGEKYEDMGWGQFGNEVQEYIQERKHSDNFDQEEKAVLETIQPLDIYEEEFFIDFGTFKLLGYKDDVKKDYSLIRDYKTASENSKAKYYTDEYKQLDIYALDTYKKHSFIPELELCIIERTGNPFKGGGRDVLKVGKQVWWHKRETNLQRLNKIEQGIIKSVKEISDYYKVFLKINK